jgi:hypothetical protein
MSVLISYFRNLVVSTRFAVSQKTPLSGYLQRGSMQQWKINLLQDISRGMLKPSIPSLMDDGRDMDGHYNNPL